MIFVFLTLIFGCKDNVYEKDQILKINFGSLSYFSQPHAWPIDVDFDGEKLLVLTNENVILEYSKNGDELKRHKVGDVIKDGNGAPRMYPGGQIVKFWKNMNDEDIILFNTVPFEFLQVDGVFQTIRKLAISDFSNAPATSAVDVYGRKGDEFLISVLTNERKQFDFYWVSLISNRMREVYKHGINEVRPFISGGRYNEEGFFFLDNAKSSFKIIDKVGTREFPIEFNKMENLTGVEKRLVELWKVYGFSKELTMAKTIFTGSHFLSLVRLNAREVEGIEKNEYFLIKVGDDGISVKTIESSMSIMIGESGIIKVFYKIGNEVIYEQKSFERLD
jgi:hypothetical protein